MKKTELLAGSKEHKDEVEFIANELKKINFEKKQKTTIQCKSTEDALNTSEHIRKMQVTDLSYWGFLKQKAEVPMSEWKERQITPQEYAIFESTRRRPKNSIGQSEKSVASDYQKEMARQAFMSTPGKKWEELTEVEKQKVTQLKKIEVVKEVKYEWKPLTPWQAFWHWLKGGKIRTEKDNGKD